MKAFIGHVDRGEEISENNKKTYNGQSLERVLKLHVHAKVDILNPCDKERLVFIKSGNFFNVSIICGANGMGIKEKW